MSVRLFLFKLACRRAHRAMRLGPLLGDLRLPAVYPSNGFDQDRARAAGASHIIVGRGIYTYAFKSERHRAWTSWSASTVTAFIAEYHYPRLHGHLAVYTLVRTQALHGPLSAYIENHRVREFEALRRRVGMAISDRLNAHLNGISHRLICRLLRLAG